MASSGCAWRPSSPPPSSKTRTYRGNAAERASGRTRSVCSASSGAAVVKTWNGGNSMVAVAFSGISHANRSAMTP